jgi:two-component system, chemotaxis family, protein-glutamate methylesterase/glutaminase
MNNKTYKLIVIGTSQGGFEALKIILSSLPIDFSVPILVVRHQLANSDDYIIHALGNFCQLKIKYAEDNEIPLPGYVYLAPPDKHLLIDNDGRLILSTGKKINCSRPAIDPFFESAAKYYQKQLLAIVLTGANHDGAEGLVAVKKQQGTIIIQDPDNAESDIMPKAALAKVKPDHLTWLSQIGSVMWNLTQ